MMLASTYADLLNVEDIFAILIGSGGVPGLAHAVYGKRSPPRLHSL
jgi:hypothetical protein